MSTVLDNPRSLSAARTQACDAHDPDDKTLLVAAVLLGEAGLIEFDEPTDSHDRSTETAVGRPQEQQTNAPSGLGHSRVGSGESPTLTYPVVALASQTANSGVAFMPWLKGQLTNVLARLVGDYRTGIALSCLDPGADQVAARAAVDAGMALWAYPHPAAPDDRDGAEQLRWRRLTGRAERTVALAADKRVDRLVADCHAMVVVWDGSPGEINDLVTHALAMRRPVVRIDPATRTISSRGAW